MIKLHRQRLMTTTVVAGLALLTTPAFAQGPTGPSSDPATAAPAGTQAAPPSTSSATVTSAADASAADEGQAIVVTGSRIASPTLTSGAPLQVVNSAAIQSTGASILQDVLQQNPIVSSPTLSRTNSNFLTSGGGVATVDLRNLGTARTLVLVNSRRFVSGIPTDTAVDLNSIPTGFIDHVDIVSGGESSIYGSDAVAGVVNIVLKKDLQGIEGNIQTGISQYGDDASKQANVTIGSNFDDDRGNVMIYAGYSRDGTVKSSDRNRTAIDQSSAGALSGDINDVFTIQRPVRSSYLPVGTFFGDLGTVLGNGNTYPAPQSARFNRSTFRYIAVPVERYLLAGRANYEISPLVNVFLETNYAKSHVHQQLEPLPADTYSSGTGIFAAEAGQYPIEQLVDGALFVNPLVPGYVQAITDDSDGDGLRDVAFSRRMSDVGNRTFTSDRSTFRVTGGFEGDFAEHWHYDAYGTYGRTDDNDTGTGQINLPNFRNALVVIPGTPGASDSLTLADGTAIRCASADARAEGCIPANVYGANTLDPRAAAYVSAPSTFNAYAQQIDIGANVTGQLFDLFGAGPIQIAFGGEYRKESSAIVYDALTQTGQNGGNKLPNTSGSFRVTEGYGEVHIPIFDDKPFFHHLEVRGAGRVSHYSTIGTVYSYSYGGLYSPIPEVTFRASRALATRAPNIGELFSGLSQTFPTGLTDPCLGITAATTGATADNCRAAAGVNANIAANGEFIQTQSDLQGISGFNGGNPNLKEEKGKTFTAGVVIAPRSIEALRNFTLTVDYTRIRISGAIFATDRQTILNQCYQQGNQAFCSLITRRPAALGTNSAGSILYINNSQVNSGGIGNDSVDAVASYSRKFGFGAVSTSVSYSRLLKGYTIPIPGAPKNNYKGEVGSAKDKFLATVSIKTGPVTLAYRGQFIGRTYLDDQFVTGLTDRNNQVPDPENPGQTIDGPVKAHDKRARVGSYYMQDLQASFDATDNFEFYLGVNNLLNIKPAPIYTNLPGDDTGTETASDYDSIGRRFYAGARFKF